MQLLKQVECYVFPSFTFGHAILESRINEINLIAKILLHDYSNWLKDSSIFTQISQTSY